MNKYRLLISNHHSFDAALCCVCFSQCSWLFFCLCTALKFLCSLFRVILWVTPRLATLRQLQRFITHPTPPPLLPVLLSLPPLLCTLTASRLHAQQSDVPWLVCLLVATKFQCKYALSVCATVCAAVCVYGCVCVCASPASGNAFILLGQTQNVCSSVEFVSIPLCLCR